MFTNENIGSSADEYFLFSYTNIFFLTHFKYIMFTVTLAKPEDETGVYEYTDVPLRMALISYRYHFDEWSNDARYIYSHRNMKNTLGGLNTLMHQHVTKSHYFFILPIAYGVIIFAYLLLVTCIYVLINLFYAFLSACLLVTAFIYGIICKMYQRYTTIRIVALLEKQIKLLNKQFKEERIYFKLINLQLGKRRRLKYIFTRGNRTVYSLRIIYKYIKLV